MSVDPNLYEAEPVMSDPFVGEEVPIDTLDAELERSAEKAEDVPPWESLGTSELPPPSRKGPAFEPLSKEELADIKRNRQAQAAQEAQVKPQPASSPRSPRIEPAPQLERHFRSQGEKQGRAARKPRKERAPRKPRKPRGLVHHDKLSPTEQELRNKALAEAFSRYVTLRDTMQSMSVEKDELGDYIKKHVAAGDMAEVDGFYPEVRVQRKRRIDPQAFIETYGLDFLLACVTVNLKDVDALIRKGVLDGQEIEGMTEIIEGSPALYVRTKQ